MYVNVLVLGGSNCISCDQKIGKRYWKQTIEPRLGFITEDPNGKPVPMHKPERDFKTDDYYVGDGSRTVLQTQNFRIGEETVRLQASKNDSLAVVGLGEHVICPFCGYATDDGDTVLKERHKNPRGYVCNYRSEGKVLQPVRLSHVFKTDVASIAFLTADAAEYDTMISVLYAILEGLSKELDIERTDIKGCLHKIKWEGSAKPIYSVILYDAVAGGAGHVRRIVTEDGVVFQRVLNRAHQIVNGCKCDPSCYSCIRNYYNQKIHDQLSRKKAAAFLANKLGECIPIQEESSSDENAHNISISGGESAEEYATWEEIFESYGFDGSGDQYDIFGIPRAGCAIMPAMSVQNETIEPYFLWEQNKVLLVDEITDDTKQILLDDGWYVGPTEMAVNVLRDALRGDS